MDTPEDRLHADLARLAGRLYSEEGIPTFLVCENLARNDAMEEPAPAALTSLNEDLASAFRRDADAWRRIRSDAPVTDAAKIVEVLADRDFATDGTEKTL